MINLPMRLAIVIPGFQADESDWCIPAFTNLARELARSAQIHVFALRYPHRKASYRIGRVNVHALGGGAIYGRHVPRLSMLKLWRDFFSLIRAVNSLSPFDAVLGIWATESGWLATRAARLLDVPSLVHLAGGELVSLRRIRYGNRRELLAGRLVAQCLGRADVITVPSSPIRGALARYFPAALSRAIDWSLGVDTSMFSPSQPVRPAGTGEFRLVSVGSLVAVKGYESLLNGMAHYRQCYSAGDVRFTIAGVGPLEGELKRLAVELAIGDLVEFAGEIRHDQLPQVYNAADAFIIGSWHEAQCVTAIEAMACGLPWMAPPVGALADIGADSTLAPSGLLVKRRAPEEWARALHEMRSLTPFVRREWGRNARATVEMRYSLDKQTQALLAIVSSLAARRTAGSA